VPARKEEKVQTMDDNEGKQVKKIAKLVTKSRGEERNRKSKPLGLHTRRGNEKTKFIPNSST